MVVSCFSLEEAPVCYPNECDLREELRRAGVECVYSYGNREIGKFKVLGVGFRGVVFLAKWNGVDVAVKVPRTDSMYDMRKEASLQRRAFPVAPKVYAFSKHYIIMEFVPYPDVSDVLDLSNINKLRKVIKMILEAGRLLDIKGIDHGELVRPWKHVRVGDKEVKILDYGSASDTRKPSNVTALASGLLLKPSPPAARIAEVLGINKADLIEALRSYKKNPNEENFKRVLTAARLLC